jgi:hypothetical protein
MLYRLIFCSTATSLCNVGELAAMTERAQAFNDTHDVTGLLINNSRFFLQSIEGARELVNDLYGRISRDPRNQHVVLIKYEQVRERMWTGWESRFLMPTAPMQRLLKRFATQDQFNPYTLHPDSAEQFLWELSQVNA